ncbi:MAG: hypothetical protein IH621_17125 [Krumholzibacteria bacterium]|nr:hypothetical protein [Candidatus Krumholzibacteria bacterium]
MSKQLHSATTAMVLATFLMAGCGGDPGAPDRDSTAEQWRWRNPLPQGNPMNGVVALKGDRLVAVGDAGTIMVSQDAGGNWVLMDSGCSVPLYAVDISESGVGYAVGEDGTIARTTNAGRSWQSERVYPGAVLWGVVAADDNTAYAVGTPGCIMKTSDRGSSWSDIGPDAGADYSDVACIGRSTVVVVGRDGTILLSQDGGRHWRQVASATDRNLQAVGFADDLRGYAVGSDGIVLRTDDGGESWESVPTDAVAMLASVAVVSREELYAGAVWVVYHSTNGGRSWAEAAPGLRGSVLGLSISERGGVYACASSIVRKDAPASGWTSVFTWTDGWLNDVKYSESGMGACVGDSGVAFTTAGAGAPWLRRNLATSHRLHGVGVVAERITAVGIKGTILSSADGGGSWEALASGTNEDLFDVDFCSPDTGMVVGARGTVLRTHDGGRTWAPCNDGVVFLPVRCVAAVGGGTAYAAGDRGYIYRTTDGGDSWQSLGSSSQMADLRGMSFPTADCGFVVGGFRPAVVMRTDDYGEKWTALDIPGLLHPERVHFVDRDHGYVVGGGGPVFVTRDGGATWHKEEVRTGVALRATWGRPDGSCIVVGRNYSILEIGGDR